MTKVVLESALDKQNRFLVHAALSVVRGFSSCLWNDTCVDESVRGQEPLLNKCQAGRNFQVTASSA